MKSRPILFSAPMVRALLAGTKTQTRRIVKGTVEDVRRPDWHATRRLVHKATCQRSFCESVDAGELACGGFETGGPDARSPFGSKGDRLWVRETWRVAAWRDDGRMAIDYRASPEVIRTPWMEPERSDFEKLIEESSDDCEKNGADMIGDDWKWEHGKSPCRWRPSIFMRRWGSRLTLEVTGVRVEQLQEIAPADAVAEGIYPPPTATTTDEVRDPVGSYRKLWNEINGAGSWASNPWVWVVAFQVIDNAPSHR